MDETLVTREKVVTAEVLERCHKGQTRLCLGPGSVLTPSARDYVARHRMDVVRGDAEGLNSETREAGPQIREVPPSVAEDTRIVQEGRCDHPDRACGCTSDEFGSGFVEPDDCSDCTVRRMPREDVAAACDGCNRQAPDMETGGLAGVDVEALVRVITDQVLARLRDME